jgi:hypothetical protein
MNPADYGYANLLQERFQEHQGDVDKAQMDLQEQQGGLKDRAIKAGEEISSAVFMKEGISNTLKYAGSKLEQMGLKGLSKAVTDYQEGGVQKVIQGGITRGLQGGKQVTQQATELKDMSKMKKPTDDEDEEEDAPADEEDINPAEEDVDNLPEGTIQMEELGELADAGDEGAEGAELASTVAFGPARALTAGFPKAAFDSGAVAAEEESDAVQQTFTSTATAAGEDVAEQGGEDLAAAGADAADAAAASAASALGSAVTGDVTSAVVATGLETAGAALDSTGIGAVVGVALGIGGVLASIFAPSDDNEESIPPPPNVSYTIGA